MRGGTLYGLYVFVRNRKRYKILQRQYGQEFTAYHAHGYAAAFGRLAVLDVLAFARTEIRLEDRTDIASIFQYNGKDIYVYEDDLQEKCEAYDVGSRIPVYLQVVTYGDGSKSYSIENILS